MNILGLVPARSGSQELKNKNLLKINGKTLIERALIQAKKSKYINKVFLSTDSSDYKKILKKLNLENNYIRPKKLATNTASIYDVARHAVSWYEKNNWDADYVVILQPTTPFRLAKDIDKVIKILIRSNADSAISITKVRYPVHWMLKLNKNNLISSIFKKGNQYIRRQDAPKYYKPSGAIYVLKTSLLKKIKYLLPTKKTIGVEMPQIKSINIDTKLDFLIAKEISKYNDI
jgi:CMP-N,N'-diacetyllegionaminic acid synthase